jgi:hypothetical protein
MAVVRFGIAAALPVLVLNCASSTPYLEHHGGYTVVTAPPAADQPRSTTEKHHRKSEGGRRANPLVECARNFRPRGIYLPRYL